MELKRANTPDRGPIEHEKLRKQLIKYEKAALAHGEATLNPDHRKANKNHDIIMESLAYLKEHGELLHLRQFLSHSSDAVRVWSATHLLSTELNHDAISVLEEIAAGKGFIASGAEMVLREWARGNLRQ